jgi:hypothetical protein
MMDECGAVVGIIIGTRNRSTQRKPDSVPLCQLQIPYDLTWDGTRAAAEESRRLTAWAMARPSSGCKRWTSTVEETPALPNLIRWRKKSHLQLLWFWCPQRLLLQQLFASWRLSLKIYVQCCFESVIVFEILKSKEAKCPEFPTLKCRIHFASCNVNNSTYYGGSEVLTRVTINGTISGL